MTTSSTTPLLLIYIFISLLYTHFVLKACFGDPSNWQYHHFVCTLFFSHLFSSCVFLCTLIVVQLTYRCNLYVQKWMRLYCSPNELRVINICLFIICSVCKIFHCFLCRHPYRVSAGICICRKLLMKNNLFQYICYMHSPVGHWTKHVQTCLNML